MKEFSYQKVLPGVFEVRRACGEVLGRMVLVLGPDGHGWTIGSRQLYRRSEDAARALAAQKSGPIQAA